MGLRQTLGRKLISAGVAVYGRLDEVEPGGQAKPTTKPPTHPAHSAVVEASDKPVQWEPHQTGNIVVAEPLMITEYRRRGGDIDAV